MHATLYIFVIYNLASICMFLGRWAGIITCITPNLTIFFNFVVERCWYFTLLFIGICLETRYHILYWSYLHLLNTSGWIFEKKTEPCYAFIDGLVPWVVLSCQHSVDDSIFDVCSMKWQPSIKDVSIKKDWDAAKARRRSERETTSADLCDVFNN